MDARIQVVAIIAAAGLLLLLLELVRRGEIAEGERVVLVVTGSGLKPYAYEPEYPAREIASDVDSALAALGVS